MAEPLNDEELAQFRADCGAIGDTGWAAVPESVWRLLATIDARDERIQFLERQCEQLFDKAVTHNEQAKTATEQLRTAREALETIASLARPIHAFECGQIARNALASISPTAKSKPTSPPSTGDPFGATRTGTAAICDAVMNLLSHGNAIGANYRCDLPRDHDGLHHDPSGATFGALLS